MNSSSSGIGGMTNPTTPSAPTIPSNWDPNSQRALGQKYSLRSSIRTVLTFERLAKTRYSFELFSRQIADPDKSPGSSIPPRWQLDGGAGFDRNKCSGAVTVKVEFRHSPEGCLLNRAIERFPLRVGKLYTGENDSKLFPILFVYPGHLRSFYERKKDVEVVKGFPIITLFLHSRLVNTCLRAI